MKGKISAILFCAAVASLIVSTYATGEADTLETQAAAAFGRPATQHLANGPKGIPPGWEKIEFVHYKKPRGKPADKPGKKPPKPESEYYTFLAKGVKWKNPSLSEFFVDTTNNAGLNSADAFDAVTVAADTWAAAPGGAGLLPSYASGEGLSADWDVPDGSNEVVFGDVPYANAIAVTIVWGIFGGPPGRREILEFDMMFDDVDFDWAIDGSNDAMDLQNIATHEFGHAVGLGDLYETACTEVTMYGYSENGETEKRTLEDPDKAGLWELYGK